VKRDTSKDTGIVWYDPERGYIFRDTEPSPEDAEELLTNRLRKVLNHKELSALLYRHDPEGLAKMGAPADEYSSEAELVLHLLPQCDSAEDVQELLYETFASQFGGSRYKGSFSKFRPAADEIYQRVKFRCIPTKRKP
jgi:hypothetical protein